MTRLSQWLWSDGRRIALLLALVTIGVLLDYWHNHSSVTDGYFSIGGIPFSDAKMWESLGANLAEGKGYALGYRPLYSMFLALFYTWTGPSLVLAKLLNIVCCAGTVGLAFLLIDRALSRPVALVTAGLLLFDEDLASYSLLTMTEIFGLFLTVASVFLMAEARRLGARRTAFLAGAVFAAANMARTLTLLAFPAYCLAFFFRLPRARFGSHGLRLALLFGAGTAVTLAPWLLRQQLVYGISSISSNSEQALYCVTSPKYGAWTGAVDKEVSDLGLKTVKEKNDYYRRGIMANIKAHPKFVLDGMMRSIGEFFSGLRMTPRAAYALAALLAAAALARFWRRPLLLGGAWLWAAGIGWLFAAHANDPAAPWIAAAGALVACVAAAPSALFMSLTLLSAGLGGALFNMGNSSRLALMSHWLFVAFFLYGMHVLFVPVWARADAAPVPAPSRWRRWGAVAATAFFALSTLKLGWANFVRPDEDKAWSRAVPDAETQQVLAWLGDRVGSERVSGSAPAFVEKAFRPREDDFLFNVSQTDVGPDGQDDGRWLIMEGELSRYLYPLPATLGNISPYKPFAVRPYDRTVFYVTPFYGVISGDIPTALRDRRVVIAGRLHVDPGIIYSDSGRFLFEAYAIVPRAGAALDFDRAYVTPSPQHARDIQSLAAQRVR